MDFTLTEEQEAIRNFVRDFCKKEITPIADDIEKKEHIPDELIAKLAEAGLFGVPYDQKYGGGGGGFCSATIVLEELARASGGVAMFLGVNYLTGIPIHLFATEEQKLKYLPDLCQGKVIGSFAFTEPATGSDPGALKTTATLQGNEYVLNGEKRFITAAGYDGTIVVFAKDMNADGKVSAFIGTKKAPGYSFSKPWEKLGMHGCTLHDVYLDNFRVPKENLLGAPGNGYNMLLDTIAIGKLDTAALCLGGAQAALDEAIKYAKDRTVRGKPIAEFQTIQCLIAEIATQVEAARWLLYRLAFLTDQKKNIRLDSAMAKMFVTEVAAEVARKAMRVHGAYGYVKDFKIERILRDVSLGEIVEGANELQKIIIANGLLR